MSPKKIHAMLVEERKELLKRFFEGDLQLPKPDAYAHDQALVRARDNARRRIYDITKQMESIRPKIKGELNVVIKSKGAANWVEHPVERAAFLTTCTVEKVRAAAESGGTMMAGNFAVKWAEVGK